MSHSSPPPATPAASSSSSSTSPSIPPAVSDILASLKPTLDNVLVEVKAECTKVSERVKTQSVEDHVVTFGITFTLCFLTHLLTKDDKEGTLTFGLVLSTLLFGLLLSSIHGLYWWVQYSSSVVFFSLLDMFGLLDSSPLWFGWAPIIIEFVRTKALALAKKAK